MIGKINLAKDVFGIQRVLPLNYVERNADRIFIDSIDRSHHVVIYGSSKQGKTSLRKKNLSDEQYILIHCNHKWEISQININILKQAGYELTLSETKTISGKAKVKATFGWNLFARVESEASAKAGKENRKVVKSFDIDPEDVNDIIHALQEIEFNRFIVLEDFHYLKPETQKDFAVELKAFHENSKYTFIIVGVWLEENRLIALNGDLAGRVKSVNADIWIVNELKKLISDGESLLNISFDTTTQDRLIAESLQNVYIVQEVCYELCIENGVIQTVQEAQRVLNCSKLEEFIQKVIDQHAGRYNQFIFSFIDGFQPTELQMHKWILYSILTADTEKLEEGFRRGEINDIVIQHHPRGEDLNPGNLTQALTSIASLQVRKGITPIIIDYDSSNKRVTIVDKGFIIWLHNQNRNEVLESAGLPTRTAADIC